LAGKSAAYGELVHRWAARITAFCHARVRSPDAAEDLAQETLLRGFRALASLAQPDLFGTWLHGIALRACLDWLKSRARKTVPLSALGPDGAADSLADETSNWDVSRVERDDEIHRLMREVEELPDDYREVLMLYYYDDVTYQDLAAMLGVSAATINARLTKARAMLRVRLSATRR
jgi:RNA polymerase sigma-70 factor (ECF subfamily)